MTSFRKPWLPLAILAAVPMLGGCHSMGGGDGSAGPLSRYQQYLRGELPDRYRNRTNPIPASPEAIAAGAALYRIHCAACHGPSGSGDGPAGAILDPPPANLAFTRMTPLGTDTFFFWTISEGGAPLGTAMPAFAGRIPEPEIWQIVRFVESGF